MEKNIDEQFKAFMYFACYLTWVGLSILFVTCLLFLSRVSQILSRMAVVVVCVDLWISFGNCFSCDLCKSLKFFSKLL